MELTRVERFDERKSFCPEKRAYLFRSGAQMLRRTKPSASLFPFHEHHCPSGLQNPAGLFDDVLLLLRLEKDIDENDHVLCLVSNAGATQHFEISALGLNIFQAGGFRPGSDAIELVFHDIQGYDQTVLAGFLRSEDADVSRAATEVSNSHAWLNAKFPDDGVRVEKTFR